MQGCFSGGRDLGPRGLQAGCYQFSVVASTQQQSCIAGVQVMSPTATQVLRCMDT